VRLVAGDPTLAVLMQPGDRSLQAAEDATDVRHLLQQVVELAVERAEQASPSG
jgi:hypothetical protein